MDNNTIFKSFKIVKKVDKGWFYFALIYPLLMGGIPLTELWLTKEFINALVSLINDGSINRVIFLLTLQIIVFILFTVLTESKTYLDIRAESLLGLFIEKKTLHKINQTEYYHFENPKFFNRVERSQYINGGTFLSPLKQVVEIVKSIIEMLGIALFLISIHWIFLIFCVIPVIPSFLVNYKYGRKRYDLSVYHTPLMREARYIKSLFKRKHSYKEIVSFNIGNYLITRWSEKYLKNMKSTLKVSKDNMRANLFIQVISIANLLSVVVFIIYLMKRAILTIGEYVTVLQAVQQSQSSMNNISIGITGIIEGSFYLNDYFYFIEHSSDKSTDHNTSYDFPNMKDGNIEINNLSFSYPGSQNKALNQVNLTIRSGETIAIVGANGSGKSTLINCLTGLYPIKKGDIKFNDIPLQLINKEKLRNNISVLFQKFISYPFTAYENIALGNIDLLKNEESVETAATLTGAHEFISNFPDKYQTFLTKELQEGEDISGGQWQKIALSRAILKGGQVLILDEPTSSLDPISERILFEKFKEVTKEKIGIFISHRINATRHSDKIIVMNKGEIVEIGSYEELLRHRGYFYDMYVSQNYSEQPN